MTIYILLGILISIDFGLIFLLVRQRSLQTDYVKQLDVLAEERQLVSQLKSDVMNLAEDLKHQSDATIHKVTILATEAEQEIRSGRDQLKTSVEDVIKESLPDLKKPLKDIKDVQLRLEKSIRSSEQARLLLNKSVERAQTIQKLLNKEFTYEQFLENIKEQKYHDARQLLAQGLPPSSVAMELKIPESEVRLLAGMRSF